MGSGADSLPHSQPKNPKEVQLIPGGYAPRPKDKMERANAAEQRLFQGHVTGEILLQALADKLNKKTNNIRASSKLSRKAPI